MIRPSKPTRVFISFSHDSPQHDQRVLDLANQLRQDGVDARIDLFEPHPAEGWQRWMQRQIEQADLVVLVCTLNYRRQFDGDETAGRSRDVNWQGQILGQLIYDAGGVSERIVPILFDEGPATSTEHSIPLPLRKYTSYRVPGEYEALYRRLTGQPISSPAALGRARELPTLARCSRGTLATRSIYLLHAPADHRRVLGLAHFLRALGHEVFCDRDSVPAGRDRHGAVREALFNADVLLVFWTARAAVHPDVERHYSEFIAKCPEQPVIPFPGDGTETPEILANRQAADVLPLTNALIDLKKQCEEQGLRSGEIHARLIDFLEREGVDLPRRHKGALLYMLFGVTVGVWGSRLLALLARSSAGQKVAAALAVLTVVIVAIIVESDGRELREQRGHDIAVNRVGSDASIDPTVLVRRMDDDPTGRDLQLDSQRNDGREGIRGSAQSPSTPVTPQSDVSAARELCAVLGEIAEATEDGFSSLRERPYGELPRPAERIDAWWASKKRLPEFERCFIGYNDRGSTWWCERPVSGSEIIAMCDHWGLLVRRCFADERGWAQDDAPARLAGHPWPAKALDTESQNTTLAWTDGERAVVVDIGWPQADATAEPWLLLGIAARASEAMPQGHLASTDTSIVAALCGGGETYRRQIARLRTSSDYKLRMSAAVYLSAFGDLRAIPVLLETLSKDDEESVRRAAAASVGMLVATGASTRQKSRVIAALEAAKRGDASATVRKEATRALAWIARLPSELIYIHVGSMSVKTDGTRGMAALMREAVERSIAKSGTTTLWPGDREPRAREPRSRDTQVFDVVATLASLTVEPKGSAMMVSCKLEMMVATYPERVVFGFVGGGARVQASSSASEVEDAKQDCVSAVVEDLTAKKIIPTIEMRTQSGSSGPEAVTQPR